jgi:uncharacterized protein (DUF2132 family)
MSERQPNNPLHGQTLEMMINSLVARYGWTGLGRRITIRCFTTDPSVQSSLKFLRKTPWARKKVEELYVASCTGSADAERGTRHDE